MAKVGKKLQVMKKGSCNISTQAIPLRRNRFYLTVKHHPLGILWSPLLGFYSLYFSWQNITKAQTPFWQYKHWLYQISLVWRRNLSLQLRAARRSKLNRSSEHPIPDLSPQHIWELLMIVFFFLLLSNVSSHCSKIGLLGKKDLQNILRVIEFTKYNLEMLENADWKVE